MAQLLFGALLAIILLGFYIWSIFVAVCVARGQCAADAFSPNFSYLLNGIGGLISATVVGVLGATQSGDFPAQKNIETRSDWNRSDNSRVYAIGIYFGLDNLRGGNGHFRFYPRI